MESADPRNYNLPFWTVDTAEITRAAAQYGLARWNDSLKRGHETSTWL